VSLTIDLAPAEEARLGEVARRLGVEPRDLARNLITDGLSTCPDLPGTDDPLLALLARWVQEDAGMTQEELDAERSGWEEFKANLNLERDRAGARRVF